MGRPDVHVSVVYCAPGVEDVSEVALPAGSTVADAVAASGVLARHAQLGERPADVGVWGRSCSLEQALEEGDRVEIYRPLTIDPKEARRVRAEVRRRRSARR
jgi:putative ubiquitin-RnfH superfamily antitoxin RatB of RatAB toxin-antitoxin module